MNWSSVRPYILPILAIVTVGLILLISISDTQTRTVSSIPEMLVDEMTYEVLNTFPHDPSAFTQGLIYFEGVLYESTGLYGESSLREVDLRTGHVLRKTDLSSEYFAEGLTNWEDLIIQLTWREGIGFVYQREDFSVLDQFTYSREGWGLTHDGENLILSDGTSTLYFIDPQTYQEDRRVTVTYQGAEINRLNELEFIQGQVFANIWQSNDIVRIEPETGEVLGWIDLQGLLPVEDQTAKVDVLNGIAYDSESDRLFVTGKRWPKLFEIKLIPKRSSE